MKKTKNLLKISAVYLGTVLGAGFASGQELVQFFSRFEKRGILGCILAGSLFCLLGGIICARAIDLSEKTHRNYLKTVFGQKTAGIFAVITELFLCVSFCVMLSGAGAFFRERFSAPVWVGVLLTDALCLLVLLFDLRGISAVNLLLAPVMLFGTLYVAVSALYMPLPVAVWLPQMHSNGRFLPYTLFYVGYNMLTATAVLVPSAALAPDKKTARAGGFLGGLFLSVMMLLCTVAIYTARASLGGNLPMLHLAGEVGRGAYVLFSAVLYMAMLTTAVSTGFSVTERLKGLGIGRKTAAACVCLAALPFSFVEFSTWVKYSYFLFGIPGAVMVFGILWDWYKGL